ELARDPPADRRRLVFQAGDVLRGGHVTGVQTCALPIWSSTTTRPRARSARSRRLRPALGRWQSSWSSRRRSRPVRIARSTSATEIGRASCRERVETSLVAASFALHYPSRRSPLATTSLD